MLKETMEEMGMSIRKLSDLTGTTYEHIRKIVKGESYPGDDLLDEICHFLHLDADLVRSQATSDRIGRKYGASLIQMQGLDPALLRLAPSWSKLTEE